MKRSAQNLRSGMLSQSVNKNRESTRVIQIEMKKNLLIRMAEVVGNCQLLMVFRCNLKFSNFISAMAMKIDELGKFVLSKGQKFNWG